MTKLFPPFMTREMKSGIKQTLMINDLIEARFPMKLKNLVENPTTSLGAVLF